jgi:hypothetical protein
VKKSKSPTVGDGTRASEIKETFRALIAVDTVLTGMNGGVHPEDRCNKPHDHTMGGLLVAQTIIKRRLNSLLAEGRSK